MLAKLAVRSDLGVVALLLATLLLMVVPLPTGVVDALIAINMGLSVLLLMVAFYLRSAAQFSTLPAIILLTTVFRLSLSIAVTRLVLTQADAGDIIQTFGEFVVAGNILVGLVIFLIITVVQFIVITKGAERIAEVAARFTLDSLPGKQMAIDADMRAGELDQATARLRRRELEQESQLYGAMDGAMKFVKGDAIAGLVIIVINLVGGLVVGVLQHGMSLAQAGQTYTILTVGDGLVAQIPALFVSITAGTVVTRVTGGEADSLGGEIALQLAKDSRALWMACGISAGMGFIPGFPTLIFLAIAGGLGLLARRASRRSAEDITAPARQGPPPPPPRVRLLLSSALSAQIQALHLDAAVARSSNALARRLGLPVPSTELVQNAISSGFRIELDGVPLADAELPPGMLLLRDDPAHADLAGVTCEAGQALPGAGQTDWVPIAQRAALQAAGVGFMEPHEALAQSLSAVLRRHASQLIGLQETKQIISAAEPHLGELVRELQRLVPTQRLADLFRRLLDEGLDLRNLRGLLESVVDLAPREQDSPGLAEAVRASMRRQICHAYADPLRVIAAFVVDADAEQALRTAIQQATGGGHLNLAEGTVSALVERVRAEMSASRGPGPVVLTAHDVRRQLRALLANNGVFAPVLSFHDLVADYTVQTLGTIRLGGADPIERIGVAEAA